MAVKIRLTRTGKKKQPTYRVVVMDGRKPRDGKYIEQIGRYDARQEPSLVEIDNERALDWLHKGAQPTERAQKLLEISGAWAQFRVEKGEIHTIGEHQSKEWPEKVHVVEAAEEVASDQLPVASSTSEGSPEEAASLVEEATEPEALEDATPEDSSDTAEEEPEEAAEEDSNEAG